MLFTELLRTRRWRLFSFDEVRTMGTALRVRARDVDELLRQLVEEDGTVYRSVGVPGHFGFVLPFLHRVAA